MRPRQILLMSTLFALGLAAGLEAGRDERVAKDMYRGHSAEHAAATLLEVAMKQAGDGSWERIAVARMHYLSGDTARGAQIFSGIDDRDASDWIRIGRVYWQAGEWEKARQAFDRVVEMKPKDEDWLAEIGAYYNLQGDRAKAEELFDRSFAEDPDNLYNTLAAAGSYLGVEER